MNLFALGLFTFHEKSNDSAAEKTKYWSIENATAYAGAQAVKRFGIWPAHPAARNGFLDEHIRELGRNEAH